MIKANGQVTFEHVQGETEVKMSYMWIVWHATICKKLNFNILGYKYWFDSHEGAWHPDQLHMQIMMLINALNHSLNFILYIISGQQFRNQFLKMITCNRNYGDSSSVTSNNTSTRTKGTSVHN